MKKSKILTGLALGAVLVMVAAACGGSSNPSSSGGTDKCKSDKFGCVTIKAGDPINFGAIATVSGSTAALGTDSDNGIKAFAINTNYVPPSITIAGQPADRTAMEGATVTFSAVVAGTEPLLYQWRFNGGPVPPGDAGPATPSGRTRRTRTARERPT